jgi:hypothetical protein
MDNNPELSFQFTDAIPAKQQRIGLAEPAENHESNQRYTTAGRKEWPELK